MILYGGQIYRTEERRFVSGELWVKDGTVRAVEQPGALESAEDERVDVSGLWLVPGLVDVHTHGRFGHDFVSADDGDLHAMAADYVRRGVTTVMPTMATAPYEDMLAKTDAVNRFRPQAGEASFCGVHWEGRYINPAKRGAHAVEYLAPLCASELDREPLRTCTAFHLSAAWELDGDASFARQAKSMGATLGLAHTMADYAAAKRAEELGIVSYTHLFNAMPPLHHRDGGAVCAALEGDRIVELICDGIHLSPEIIRLVWRIKGGDQISLISDSMEATGCPDGHYSIAGMPVTVRDGIARTDDNGALAGSTLSLDTAVNRLMEFCRIPLTEALVSATATPAKQMGVFDTCGSIDVGKRADILFLDNLDSFRPIRTLLRGEWVSHSEREQEDYKS